MFAGENVAQACGCLGVPLCLAFPMPPPWASSITTPCGRLYVCSREHAWTLSNLRALDVGAVVNLSKMDTPGHHMGKKPGITSSVETKVVPSYLTFFLVDRSRWSLAVQKYLGVWVFGCSGIRTCSHSCGPPCRHPGDLGQRKHQARAPERFAGGVAGCTGVLGRNGTLLVHCYQGKHRAGAFVGVLLVPRAM